MCKEKFRLHQETGAITTISFTCGFTGRDDSVHPGAFAWQECVLLKETLTAGAAVAALPKMQEGVPCQRNVFDDLHSIVMYTLYDSSAGRAIMLSAWKPDINSVQYSHSPSKLLDAQSQQSSMAETSINSGRRSNETAARFPYQEK